LLLCYNNQNLLSQKNALGQIKLEEIKTTVQPITQTFDNEQSVSMRQEAGMSTQKKTADEKKSSLLDSLSQVRAEILRESRQFKPGEEAIPFIGVWSLLDLLAHLAGWDVTNVQAAQEVLVGKIPSFYAHHSKDWADYNALLVNEYGKASLPEILATVEGTHKQLINFLEKLPAKALFADHGVRAGSYRVIISRLLEAERKDETRHLRQIVEFLDERRA
jgi:hypothetical protein